MLITRPEPDAGETAVAVAARGLRPVVAPLLTVRVGSVVAENGIDAVLVTSRNAVGALDPALHGLPLLAVGGASAARARAAGFLQVMDADGDAEALLSLTLRTVAAGGLLLFAHGAGQGDWLAGSLERAGYRVSRRVAYRSEPVAALPAAAAAALAEDQLRSATFLSAATARAFVQLLPEALRTRLTSVRAVAIGAAAADALTPLPWQEVRVSVRPTLEEVLALL